METPKETPVVSSTPEPVVQSVPPVQSTPPVTPPAFKAVPPPAAAKAATHLPKPRNILSSFAFLTFGAATTLYYGDQLHYQQSSSYQRLKE